MLLQILDEDEATVLFDLNDPTGAANPYGMKTEVDGDSFDWGSVDTELGIFATEDPGGRVIRRRDPIVTGGWRQFMENDTVDRLKAGLGVLKRFLRNPPGPFLWRDENATELRYVDVVGASPLPQALRGQDRGLYTVSQLKYLVDLPIIVQRQPYMRGATIAQANVLTNPTLFWPSSGGGTPTGWTGTGVSSVSKDSYNSAVTGVFDAGEMFYQEVAASPGEVWTASVDAALVSGTRPARLTLSFRSAAAELASVNVERSAATYDRLTVTSAAAPAGTTLVRISLGPGTTGSGSPTLGWRLPKLEEAAAATPWDTGTVVIENDVSEVLGRAVPIWIPGDAEVGVRFRMAGAAGQMIVAAREMPRGLPTYLSLRAFQCENGSVSTDTTDDVADANASGGACIETSFGTNTLIKRLTQSFSAANLPKGEYRIFLRCRAVTNNTPMELQLQTRQLTSSGSLIPSPAVEYTLSSTYQDVFLGDVEIPDGVLSSMQFEVWARRVSGSGALRMDHLMLVPLPALSWLFDANADLESTAAMQTDPDAEEPLTAYVLRTSDLVVADLNMIVNGPTPHRLKPGWNAVVIFNGANTTDPRMQHLKDTDLAEQITLTLEFEPSWLD